MVSELIGDFHRPNNYTHANFDIFFQNTPKDIGQYSISIPHDPVNILRNPEL